MTLHDSFPSSSRNITSSPLLTSPLKPGKAGPVRNRLMDNAFLESLDFTLTNKLLNSPENRKKRQQEELERQKKLREQEKQRELQNQQQQHHVQSESEDTDIDNNTISSFLFDEYSSDEETIPKKIPISKLYKKELKKAVKKDIMIASSISSNTIPSEPLPTPIHSDSLSDSQYHSFRAEPTSNNPFTNMAHPSPTLPSRALPLKQLHTDHSEFLRQEGDKPHLHSTTPTDSENSEHSESFTASNDTFSSPSSIESSTFSPSFPSTSLVFSTAPTSVTSSFITSTATSSTATISMRTEDSPSPDPSLYINSSLYFDVSSELSPSDSVTLSYLVQSAIANTRGSKVLSDNELRDAQTELRLLKSRQRDIRQKITMEKKIQESAQRLADSGIGKWKSLDALKIPRMVESKRSRPLSKHALDEVSLATHHLNLLEKELETNISRVAVLETTIEKHTAAILALTHPGSGTEFAWSVPSHLNNAKDKDIESVSQSLSFTEDSPLHNVEEETPSINGNSIGTGTPMVTEESNVGPVLGSDGRAEKDLSEMKNGIQSLLEMIHSSAPDLIKNEDHEQRDETESKDLKDLHHVIHSLLQKYDENKVNEKKIISLEEKQALLNIPKHSNSGSNTIPQIPTSPVAPSTPSTITPNSESVTPTEESHKIHHIQTADTTPEADRTITSLNQQIHSLQSQLDFLKLQNSSLQSSVTIAAQRRAASVLLLRHQFSKAVQGMNTHQPKIASNWQELNQSKFNQSVKEVIVPSHLGFENANDQDERKGLIEQHFNSMEQKNDSMQIKPHVGL